MNAFLLQESSLRTKIGFVAGAELVLQLPPPLKQWKPLKNSYTLYIYK